MNTNQKQTEGSGAPEASGKNAPIGLVLTPHGEVMHYVRTLGEIEILRRINSHEALVAACEGMLGNYLELKRLSLMLAKSDAPNWIMAGSTAEDDRHVIAVRVALAAANLKPQNSLGKALPVIDGNGRAA